MFKSSDVVYWKPFNFNNISFIFGVGYAFCLNCLFIFLKSIRKRTWLDLFLGCMKYWDPHSESFATSRDPSRNKFSTSFLKISLCTFGTGYGREHIAFESSFNLKSNGYVSQVPSFQSKNSSDFCHNFRNSLRCVSVRFWPWFYITLFKFSFSYLASNITCNNLVAVRTCSDS